MTLTPSDAGAGVATTYYTTDGSTPDTNSPQGTSIPLSADGVYTIKYFSVDRVGNAEAVQTGASQIRIDATNPSSSTLDVLPAAIRNGQVLSGSAADATSGVATVAYYRCTGTSCSPSTLVGSSSTGPSYSVTWNSQPADGDYQVLARATDAAGNTLDSAKQTIKVDNSDPTGSLTSPAGGASLSGTVTVASNSADSVSSVAQVVFQRSPAGAGTWTTIDTDSSAPYSVDWVTGGVTDGDYDLRAQTTDAAGNSFTSGSITVEVDNTAPTASLDDPGANLRGTVSLTGSASDPGGSGVASLTFQRSPASGGSWTTIDTDTSSPYSVSFDTTGVSDGLYDLRAVATDVAGNTTISALVANRRVDNTAPNASLDDPGANLRATVTLTSTASDPGGSGVASRAYQYSPAGAGTWSATPAAFDTTGVTDGLYDLRVIVTDNAGNSTTSATVANRRVDNTAPSASLDDPGANLRATVTLSSTASDAGSGVATRTYQHSPAGAGTWTTTPAAFDTTGVTDGLYDLRVIVTDNAGNSTTSATVTNRRVDNTAPSASLDDPGANLRGTVTLSSTASDAGSGVATRTYQHSPAGAGTWTTTPAAFDTTGVTDGLYDLRVIVTDNAGNSTTSATVTNRRVDNTNPTGSVTAPAGASVVSGLTAVSSDSADAGSGVQQVIFQRSPAGAGTWTAIDTDTSAPYSVDWSTGALADGSYDLRAVTGDVAGNSQTSAIVNVLVDNNAPSVTITAPGAFVNAAAPDPFTIAATTPDTDIDNVEFFRCSNVSTGCASGSWISLGTDTTVPYEAQWNVDADGNRALRAVATDLGSNTDADTNDVTIDRAAPTGTQDDPGANLRGTVSLTGSGSDPGGSGVASLAFQRSPAGAGTWTTVDTDTSAPYSASFDTTGVTDGLYDLRVIVTDNAGNSTTSATVANRRVDNTAPSATPGRSGRQPACHRHAQLDCERRRLRGRHPHLPALSCRRRHLDDDSGRLRHDRRHGRALRPARDRHRQRRQLDHLGHGREPPGRQHGSQRQPGRSGRQPARDGHAQLDCERRRLRGRHPHLSALSRRRRHLDDDSGCLRHDRRHGRALRPARDRHRQRRQLDHLGHGREPPGRQHGSQRQPGRSGRQPARHGHALLDRERRRLRDRHPHLSALSCRRRHLDDDSGCLRHDRRYGRALRPARDRHRQRR